MAQVEILYNSLKVAGFEPWLDVKDILPGQNWKQALSETITKSDYFLACLSEKALDKRGFVHAELKMALDMLSKLPASKTYIIPARLSPVQPPEELFGFQWVDIFGTHDIEKLVNALKEMWRNNNKSQLLTTPLHPRQAGERLTRWASNKRRSHATLVSGAYFISFKARYYVY